MSDSIEKIAVFDPRIVQRSPVQYAVEQGAASQTNTNFIALSQSTSQHTYQIQVPSENVFLDKAVDWTSTVFIAVSVTIADETAGHPVLILGRDVALAPFPLHQLVSTMTATINDTTVSLNTSDVLPQLLRLSDSKKNRTLRTCPTYLDTYQSYNDAAGAWNNPLAGYENAINGNPPNGAYWNIDFTNAAGASIAPPVQVDGTNAYTVYLKFTSTEKLILSPFCFSDVHENETGLFGLQNIQLSMNMNSPAIVGQSGRVLRSTDVYGKEVTGVVYNTAPVGGAFQNSQISCLFLTPSLALPMPSLSRVNYMEFPRYIQSVTPSDPIASGATLANQSSQTITLPCIPDLIIISARPTSYGVNEADWNLPITNISVNFDNFSGLMSSLTTAELFSLSQLNGLDMSWSEFNGQSVQAIMDGDQVRQQFTGTVGGFLVLKPSRDITLQLSQAPSNVGNYTFQFNYSVYNPSQDPVAAYQLVVITANSGFFESIRGSSRVVKGVLSQKDVTEATNKGAVTRSEVNRYVGGSLSGMVKGLSTGVQKAMPIIKAMAPLIKSFLPSDAQDLMSAVGFGKKGLSKRLM